MSKAATAVTKTADNAINFLRFMTLSFRDLSFGRDTMDGAPDGPTADFMRGVIRWLTHGSVWQETESGFVVGLQRRTYSRIMRDRRIRIVCRESRGPRKMSNPPGGVYYLAERNSITEMIQARK